MTDIISDDGLLYIKDEIVNDPVNMGYKTAQTESGVQGIVNLVNDSAKRPGTYSAVVPRSQLKTLLLQNGKLIGILSDNSHSSCQIAKYFLSDADFTTINISHPAFLGTAQALMADGFINQADLDQVSNLGKTYQSRATELGWAGWTVEMVSRALTL